MVVEMRLWMHGICISIMRSMYIIIMLVGGFKYFLFSPLFGGDSHFDQYFSDGLKPPTRMICENCMIIIPYYYHMPYQIKNDFFLELHAYLNLLA